MEQPQRDPEVMERACSAASALGIPVVNTGPGGASDDEESLKASIKSLSEMAKIGEAHGVTICVKAHVGASIYNTPTTLRIMEAIDSPAFGIDMDPSHIHRAGENPAEAIAAVMSRVKHVHIRDCKGNAVRSGQTGGSSERSRRYRPARIRPRLCTNTVTTVRSILK